MERTAGRVILVHDDSVLMMQGGDPSRPDDGEWLFTIGGGCEPGESTADAARREAFEEAGVHLFDDLGPVVLHRVTSFDFNGTFLDQTEDYFLVRVATTEVDVSRWTDEEREAMSGVAWWTTAELRATPLTVYPEGLADLVASLGVL